MKNNKTPEEDEVAEVVPEAGSPFILAVTITVQSLFTV